MSRKKAVIRLSARELSQHRGDRHRLPVGSQDFAEAFRPGLFVKCRWRGDAGWPGRSGIPFRGSGR